MPGFAHTALADSRANISQPFLVGATVAAHAAQAALADSFAGNPVSGCADGRYR